MYVFDTRTGRWLTIATPSETYQAVTLVRSELFCVTGSDVVNELNTQTGQWAIQKLRFDASGRAAAATIGNLAVVVSNDINNVTVNDDLFIATADAPPLTGTLTGVPNSLSQGDVFDATVTVLNSGNTAFNGPFTVVYASPSGKLNDATAIGAVTVNQSIPPSSRIQVSVTADSYFLSSGRNTLIIAAVGTAGDVHVLATHGLRVLASPLSNRLGKTLGLFARG